MKLLKTMFLLVVLVLALAPALAACAPSNTIILDGSTPAGTPKFTLTGTAVNSAPLPAPGRTAPAISLSSLQGQTVKLSDFLGKPVLVNFFATWCGPCRSEMGYLQAIDRNAEFQQAGFTLLEVNIQEDAGTVQKFLQDNGLNFSSLLLDTDAVAARAYNVSGIPASFFIDGNGIIQKVKIGAYADQNSLERDVRALISQ